MANLDALPFTVRVLLENALRHAGGEFVDAETVKALAAWAPRRSAESSGMELPFLPGRVILQDFTGVPAVVDLSLAMKAPLPVYSINAPQFIPGVDFSDQRNYWHAGYSAVMITDTAFYRNRNYHTAEDTAEKLDYKRMAMVVEGVDAIVMDLSR